MREKILNVPNLRFPKYNLPLKIEKLEKVCEINPKASKLQDEFIYIDLESVVKGELIKKEKICKKNAPSRAQRVLKYNDICFQCVRPYQLNNYHFKILDSFQWVASTGYAQIRTSLCNPAYLYQVINSKNFNKQVMLRCTGSSYPAINSKDLGKIEIGICDIEEQDLISIFLAKIDNRIQTQNKIIKDLEIQKKSIYDKIFKKIKCQSVPLKKLCLVNKGEQINGTELTEYGDYYFMNGGIVPSGYYSQWNTEKDTISISEGGNSCGYVQFNKEKFWAGGHCYTLIKVKCNNMYLYHYLKANESRIMKMRIGSGLPNIQKKSIESIPILLPDNQTQQKLSYFFNLIENKISMESELLEKYKEQKKFLLSNMFI